MSRLPSNKILIKAFISTKQFFAFRFAYQEGAKSMSGWLSCRSD